MEKKLLEGLGEGIYCLKTDLLMLEGLNPSLDSNTVDYHDRICGFIGQHLRDVEMFAELLGVKIVLNELQCIILMSNPE